ncbi:MAG: hypothetical protein KDD69_00015 [Bdellovibrionales bacterium]|nr:hypothetical protein [Bdellovibrionales bacterium]
MKLYILPVLSVLLCAVFLGCEGGMGKKPERNVIKEYVNEPKERARAAGEKLNAQHEKLRQQTEELAED